MNLFNVYTAVLLAGVALAAFAYWVYKRSRTGKINVFRITGEKFLLSEMVRPDANGFLKIQGRAYIYSKPHVLYSRSGLIKEWSPCLLYLDEDPNPVAPLDPLAVRPNPRSKTAEVKATSRELFELLNGSVVRDFMQGSRSKVTNDRVLMAVVGVGACLAVIFVGGAWWILNTLTPPVL